MAPQDFAIKEKTQVASEGIGIASQLFGSKMAEPPDVESFVFLSDLII